MLGSGSSVFPAWGRVLGGGGSTLLNGLVSYWSLDEASGVRYDAVGDNDLTDNNTVGSAAGKNNLAASFVAANNEWLSTTGIAAPQGKGDMTLAVWVKPDAGDDLSILDMSEAYVEGPWLFTSGGVIRNYTPNVGAAYTAGSWNLLVMTYTLATDTLGIRVNNGTLATVSGLPTNATGTLKFGRSNGYGRYYSGLQDEGAVWSRVLTTNEQTELFAAGAGKFYPFTS